MTHELWNKVKPRSEEPQSKKNPRSKENFEKTWFPILKNPGFKESYFEQNLDLRKVGDQNHIKICLQNLNYLENFTLDLVSIEFWMNEELSNVYLSHWRFQATWVYYNQSSA